jgi:WD40 repeat protein
LTALSGGRVQLSDGSNGRTQDLTADGITVAVFLNRDQMLVGTKAGAVRIYDAASGAAVSFLGKHRDQVTSVSLTSYGRRAITASRDGTIMVFNLEANDGILNQWNLQQPISMVRASPDGLLLAVACGDWLSGSGRVRLLELASGRPQLELLAGTAISTLSFRQDSKMLLTADWEGRVIFWDVATGEQCGYGRIAKDEISADSFCPDNDVLASVVMLELFEENVSDHSPQALLE